MLSILGTKERPIGKEIGGPPPPRPPPTKIIRKGEEIGNIENSRLVERTMEPEVGEIQ